VSCFQQSCMRYDLFFHHSCMPCVLFFHYSCVSCALCPVVLQYVDVD
jgi:hypothetical protein